MWFLPYISTSYCFGELGIVLCSASAEFLAVFRSDPWQLLSEHVVGEFEPRLGANKANAFILFSISLARHLHLLFSLLWEWSLLNFQEVRKAMGLEELSHVALLGSVRRSKNMSPISCVRVRVISFRI